jgi:phosphoglycerate kinase
MKHKELAEIMSTCGYIYLNDAVSCSHRLHASVDAIMECLPSCPGIAMQTELHYLNMLLPNKSEMNKKRLALIGGFKVSTKFAALKSLATSLDKVMIGGAMANTFLHSQGIVMGDSFVEHGLVGEVAALYERHKDRIMLPVDVVCLVGEKLVTLDITDLPSNARICDIGPKTVSYFQDAMAEGLVVYNGPLGKYEDLRFAASSNAMARYIADLTIEGKITSIVGGGDTLSAINAYDPNLLNKFSYASTAGGAMLDWMQHFSLTVIDKLFKMTHGILK